MRPRASVEEVRGAGTLCQSRGARQEVRESLEAYRAVSRVARRCGTPKLGQRGVGCPPLGLRPPAVCCALVGEGRGAVPPPEAAPSLPARDPYRLGLGDQQAEAAEALFRVRGYSGCTRLDKVDHEFRRSRYLESAKTVLLYTIGFSAENCPNKVIRVTSPSNVRYVCYIKRPFLGDTIVS